MGELEERIRAKNKLEIISRDNPRDEI